MTHHRCGASELVVIDVEGRKILCSFSQFLIYPVHYFVERGLLQHQFVITCIGRDESRLERYGTVCLQKKPVVIGYHETRLVLHQFHLRRRNSRIRKRFHIVNEYIGGTDIFRKFRPVVHLPFGCRRPVSRSHVEYVPSECGPCGRQGTVVAHRVIAGKFHMVPVWVGDAGIDSGEPVFGSGLVVEDHLQGQFVFRHLIEPVAGGCSREQAEYCEYLIYVLHRQAF